MKRILGSICVTLCMSVVPLQALQQKKPLIVEGYAPVASGPQKHPSRPVKLGQKWALEESAPRGLLLFLDDSEKNGEGAVTNSFVTALSQNAGPIIVSASLLFNIFLLYKESLSYTNTGGDLLKPLPILRKRLLYALLKNSNFNPARWVIKKINDSLYLLIPHAYLNSLGIDISSAAAYSTNAISAIEKQLGLMVNHMATITDIQTITKPADYSYADYFMDALRHEVGGKIKSDIFCVRSDYNKGDVQPEWFLYMMGHGGMRSRVVGLALDSFKKVLDFFDTKIATALLVYLSCYAAGTNTELIYKESHETLQKTYSFPIITQALTDAPVNITFTQDVVGGVLMVFAFASYDRFLKEVAESSGVISYEKVVADLFQGDEKAAALIRKSAVSRLSEELREKKLAELLEKETKNWSNTAQIKFPGIEWFSIVDSNKEIAAIGSILAKTWDVKKPFYVDTFFSKVTPKAILLYAKDIPFELVINGSNLKAIISMIPGYAVHTIKKISSTQSVFPYFQAVKDLMPEKIFFIKKLIDKTGSYENVIIHNDKSVVRLFYEQDKQCYVQISANKELCTASQKKQYQGLLARARGEVNTEEAMTNVSVASLKKSIGEIKGVMVFEKIEGMQGGDDVDALMFACIDIMQQDSLAVIKHVSGNAGNLIKGVSNQWITINDVVVTSQGYFFTYNSQFYWMGRAAWNAEITPNDYKEKYKEYMGGAKEIAHDEGLTQEGIEKIRAVFAKPVEKKQAPEIRQTHTTKRQQLEKALDDYRYHVPTLPTIQQSILIQLSQDSSAGLNNSRLSDELVEVYWDMYQKASMQK